MDCLVLDVGSSTTKIHYSGNDNPRAFPSIVGISPQDAREEHLRVGEEALIAHLGLILRRPITRGLVADWANYHRLLHHAYYIEMRRAPEEHALMLTEPSCPVPCAADRNRQCQLLFEEFTVPALCVRSTAALSLLLAKRHTGLALEIGATCKAVPVFDGHPLAYAAVASAVGGDEVEALMMRLLCGVDPEVKYAVLRGMTSPGTSPLGLLDRHLVQFILSHVSRTSEMRSCIQEVLSSIQEKVCRVRGADNEEPLGTSYELPYERKLSVPGRAVTSPEALFRPELAGLAGQQTSMVDAVCQSIAKCDPQLREQMASNIVLSGGASMPPGLPERLTAELRRRLGNGVQVIARPERRHMAWIGGSLLAELEPPPGPIWITRQEYDECGPVLVNRRCFV